MRAEAREKARLDELTLVNYAISAKKEGIKIGEVHGAARAYKEMGIPIADIAAKTGLSVEEIERL
jgi:hypothetical protein